MNVLKSSMIGAGRPGSESRYLLKPQIYLDKDFSHTESSPPKVETLGILCAFKEKEAAE
jgi:hypothetical protein